MESLDPKCTELKTKYEECFKHWYSTTYLPTPTPHHVHDDCKPLFDEYRECLKHVLSAKGIDKMLSDSDVS